MTAVVDAANLKRKRTSEVSDEENDNRTKVVYIADKKLLFETTKIPHIKNRVSKEHFIRVYY